MVPVAVLDANVLFPMILRDTLLRVAAAGCFRVHWSARILEEMFRNLLDQDRLTLVQAERLAVCMAAAFPEAEVADWEALEPAMTNDPKDRHVAAAALQAGAQYIVTENVKDFAPLPEGPEAYTPDVFLLDRLQKMPTEVLAALRKQASGYRNPPASINELLEWLEHDLPDFVSAARATLAAEGPR